MQTITRQRRTDSNGEPVIAYWRIIGAGLVYRYADGLTLYSGATDKRLATFDDVETLEASLSQHI